MKHGHGGWSCERAQEPQITVTLPNQDMQMVSWTIFFFSVDFALLVVPHMDHRRKGYSKPLKGIVSLKGEHCFMAFLGRE